MSKKVLIVDDDADFAEAITALLDAKGYSVSCAKDGEEGWKMAKSGNPDLILLDVMMSQRTQGFDVARRLHEDAGLKGIPVVVITGIRGDMNLPFAFEPNDEWLNVKMLLEKPIKSDVLLKTVEQYIRK